MTLKLQVSSQQNMHFKIIRIFLDFSGLPKKHDRIRLGKLKNNIYKAYIIGKHSSFLKNN